MSPENGNVGKRARFLPNPNEPVHPPTVRDAIEDAIRFMATLQPRAVVIEEMKKIVPARIVEAIQGITVNPRMNGLELHLANTIEYCIMHKMLRNPTEAVMTLADVKFDLEEGGVFVGRERIPNQQ